MLVLAGKHFEWNHDLEGGKSIITWVFGSRVAEVGMKCGKRLSVGRGGGKSVMMVLVFRGSRLGRVMWRRWSKV